MPPRRSFVRLIQDDIQQRVAKGELQPGDQLPTHAQLAEQYGCSEQPVKAALQILTALGVVEPHQGKGVYIAGSAGAE